MAPQGANASGEIPRPEICAVAALGRSGVRLLRNVRRHSHPLQMGRHRIQRDVHDQNRLNNSGVPIDPKAILTCRLFPTPKSLGPRAGHD